MFSLALLAGWGRAAPGSAQGEVAQDEAADPLVDGEPPPPGTGAPAASDPADFEDPGRRSDPWVLDDRRGADVRWTPRAPDAPSQLAMGAQLGIGALPGGDWPVPEGPLIEVGVLVDLRYSPRSPWHVRGVLALSAQQSSGVRTEFGDYQTGAWGVWLRLMSLAVDLFDVIALRAGPELGLQWVSGPGTLASLELVGGGLAEVGYLFADPRIEVGVYGGARFTAIHVDRLSEFELDASWVTLQGVVGAYASALFF